MYALALLIIPPVILSLFCLIVAKKRLASNLTFDKLLLGTVVVIIAASVLSRGIILDKAKSSAKEHLLFITQVNHVKMRITIDGKLIFCGKPEGQDVYTCAQQLQGEKGLSTSNSTDPVEFLEIIPDPKWSLFYKEHYFVARVINY